jgi:hypothetical protein
MQDRVGDYLLVTYLVFGFNLYFILYWLVINYFDCTTRDGGD